ncbi:MAG: hypothetical protein RL654_1910 [Pseudomonadota bacterium]|jgi:hypothetical protein
MIRTKIASTAAALAALLIAAAAPTSVAAETRHAAVITLDGNGYLQAGQVLNDSSDGITLTGFWYSMGAQEAGIGVWERYEGGHQALDALAGTSDHYSTAYWGGLSLGGGQSMRFGGLDLDRIAATSPVSIDSETIDRIGSSLRHAYVEVLFSDGLRGRVALAAQPWNTTQELTIQVASPVPEPAAAAMFATGLLGLTVFGRRRAQGATQVARAEADANCSQA